MNNYQGLANGKRVFVLVMLTAVLMASFCSTALAEPLDIHRIDFWEGKYWWDGVLEDKPYGLWVSVSGSGITDANMTLPDGNSVTLQEGCAPDSGWGFEIEDYNSLAELRADFNTGNYAFSFNGGADSVTLYRDPNEPTDFPVIIYPADGDTNVSLNPMITWQSCVGYGDAVVIGVFDEMSYTVHLTGFIDINQTSWMAGPLQAGHLHELEAVVLDGTASQPYSRTTAHGDGFLYYDLFEYCNTIQFITIGTIAPFYQPQTILFMDPNVEFVFIKDTNDANSWAGEDYGAVRVTGILNENEGYSGLLLPETGFDGQQGAFLVYDVNDESGNGALCALTTEFSESKGGPGQSGLPTNLSGATLTVDIAFIVPGRPSVSTLSKALGFWLLEADGDNFEMDAIMDLNSGWQSYSVDIDDMAAYGTYTPGGGTFGDSPVALMAIEFEDPNTPEGLDTIIYFVDNFLITEVEDAEPFFEDFEAKCPSSNEADLNGDCEVNFKDFAIFADEWLWQASWY